MMSNDLSEYERKRLENIKQNQEILKSLNIKGIIPEKPAVPAAKKARGVVSAKVRTQEPAKIEEPRSRRISSRLLKKTIGFEGLDEDFVKIEREIIDAPSEPARPKRIIGKIPFDPEEGASAGFIELTGSLKNYYNSESSGADHKINYEYKKSSEKDFEDFFEIQNELSVVKIMKERIYSLAIHPDPTKVLIAAGGKFGELSFLDATECAHPDGLSDRELPEAKDFHPGVFLFKPHTGSI